MQIHIEEQLNKRLQDVSKAYGVDEQQLIKQAILLYLDTVTKNVDLRRELAAWDALSDEAMLSLEQHKH
jgi:hypothetical protein